MSEENVIELEEETPRFGRHHMGSA